MTVLVTDGNERAALAVTRALGRERIAVTVGSEADRSLAGASRYCSRSFRYPSPYEDPKGFIDALLEKVRADDVRVVIPISDMAMQLVGERLVEFESHAVVPAPPLSTYEAVSDKYQLTKQAEAWGVPIPETLYVERGMVPENLEKLGPFPIIVKPGKSRLRLNGAWVRTTVHQAADRSELERLYRELPYLQAPSLLQRRVGGEGQAIFALCDRGTPLALFAHRRLREKPPSGGVSVVRESIELPKPMVDYAVQLLKKSGWHGVAMVEFKVERETGIPRLMEINGRFWGSLQLAIDAGINFPHLLYQLAIGRPVSVPQGRYRVGVRSRWLLGDLDHLLARILKPDQVLGLPAEYPSRARCLGEFVRFWRADQFLEVERWNDRGPARHEWGEYMRMLVSGHA